MPYIAINTPVELSESKKETLKAELGRLISIIPGKSEADLMVELCGGRAMFMGGGKTPCAYIDLRMYKKAEAGAKQRFTTETLTMLNRELGIEMGNLYMTITEFEQWGYDGALH